MRKQMGWVAVGLSLGMLAGCQATGEQFQVQDQRSPEQVGLRVEWLRDLGRSDILKTEPSNYGQYYANQGELTLRVLRVTNTSAENREIYPSVAFGEGVAPVTLRQDYWSVCPRSLFACDVVNGPSVTIDQRLSEYRSEFDVVAFDFDFDNGGHETFNPDPGAPTPAPVTIRAGEAGVLVLHLKLRSGFSLLSTAAGGIAGTAGTQFLPVGLPVDPASYGFRTESLIGNTLDLDAKISILSLDPNSEVLNPLYFGLPPPLSILNAGTAASLSVVFPPPKVANRVDGLAVQF
jgi:hypothetical protein